MTTDQTDRAVGALVGLACGDALGRPVEFRTPFGIEKEHGTVTEMLGDGTHGQPAGTVTDDTDLALCIARSLAANGGFDGADIANRFIDWYESGPFDIGRMTMSSIRRLQQGESWQTAGHNEWEASAEGSNAGNGSLMRTAPHGVAFADDPDAIVANSAKSSAITHADPRCQASCALFDLIIANYVQGVDPFEPAISTYQTAGENEAIPTPSEVLSAVESVTEGTVDHDDLNNSGYVIHTFQTALYHAVNAETAEDAIVNAVNMGGDTDTIAAVTGALVGARDGVDAIPQRWRDEVDETDELTELATELVDIT